jgi:hypothetical protein
MIYFRDTDTEREKYEIAFDKDVLRELMREIAVKCGEKSFVKKECTQGRIPNGKYFDNQSQKNYLFYSDINYTLSPNKGEEWEEYYCYEVDLYYCNYYQYYCPELVAFIDEIIYEDPNTIELLFNGDFSSVSTFLKVKDKVKSIQQEVATHSQEYLLRRNAKLAEINGLQQKPSDNQDDIEKSVNDLSLWMKRVEEELLTMDKEFLDIHKELKDKLDYYLSIEDLNKNQEDLSPFIERLLSLIEIRLVDRISLAEINRVNSFLSDEVPKEKEMKLVRKL